MEWTIQKILTWTQGFFGEKGIDTARLDAELLLAHVLGVERIYLYTHFDKPLSEEERAGFRGLVKRRAKREPVAYILGEREFFSRAFIVTPDVLVPRPETEHVVEQVLAWCETHGVTSPTIADVGTGSGCLAVTLACELPEARIIASDISAGALGVARENAERHGVQERVEFREGSVLDPLTGPVNIIVSNPPYIPEAEGPTLPPDVRDFEPRSALLSGTDGLDVIRVLCRDAWGLLRQPGVLMFEIDGSQEEATHSLLRDNQTGWSTRSVKDLQGHPRVVVAEKMG